MRSLLCTLLVLALSATAVAADYTDKDMVGRWYRGDHLGYNVLLTLSPDHTYKATWTGDEIDPKTNRPGEYGSASGKWKPEGDHLVITPQKETKDTKGDVASMRLRRQRGKIVFTPLRPLPVPTIFHLDPMMVFERESQ
ncbi:MAG: hypothetical protein ACR2G0_00115 [Chthoniobacterales bacterium]